MSEATRNAVEVLTYKVQIFARLAVATMLQGAVREVELAEKNRTHAKYADPGK